MYRISYSDYHTFGKSKFYFIQAGISNDLRLTARVIRQHRCFGDLRIKIKYRFYARFLKTKRLTVYIYLSAYPNMQKLNTKDILFAYSEETRLRIALLVYNSEICVNCLVAVLKLPQSTISRHIGIMRRACIVNAKRKGTNTYYSANTGNTAAGKLNKDLLETYSKNLKKTAPFAIDRQNLLKQKHVCTVDCKVDCKAA